MIFTDEQLLADVVAREGDTYTDRPSDRGGPTRFGITQATLASWRGRPVTPAEVAALTRDEALTIYRVDYVQRPGFSKIGDGWLRALCVDCGVLHGPAAAVAMLQRALGVRDDGVFGPTTEAALHAVSPRRVFLGLFAQRLSYIGRLVTKDRTDADHDGVTDAAENDWGWMNRNADILRAFAQEVTG